jgi:flagellar biosynthetic protein FliR
MPKIELFSLGSFLVLGQQLLIGIALGLMTQFLLETFVMAGQVIAMQTSLGFATLVDPMNGQSAPVVGQFYLMLATLVFLAVDGHPLMLRMVVLSFETLPVSDSGLTLPAIRSLVSFLGVMYQASLVMALSAIIALLLINFAFGVMTRAAPQLNIFSIGFAVSMMSGLFILWLTIGGFMGHFDALWERVQETSCELINVQCLGASMTEAPPGCGPLPPLAGRQSADAGRRPAWLIPIRNAQNNPRANDCNRPGKKGRLHAPRSWVPPASCWRPCSAS